MEERQTWGTLPPFKQAALPRFPGMLAALGPGVIFLALLFFFFFSPRLLRSRF